MRAMAAGKAYTHALTVAHTHSEFVRTVFFNENISIASQSRGFGYWLWKPYYIYESLKHLDDGDVLIYCDAGVELCASVDPLLALVKESKTGVVLFENYQGSAYLNKTVGLEINEHALYRELNKNKYWVKRDAFNLMGLDNSKYWESPQVDACFQMYRKCDSSLHFVEEWLRWCCVPRVMTDIQNQGGLENFSNFIGHVHDQSIVSLLACKHAINLFRSPSQYGNHYKLPQHRVTGEYLLLPYAREPKCDSDYGTLLNHHRSRTMRFMDRLRTYAGAELNILYAMLGHTRRG